MSEKKKKIGKLIYSAGEDWTYLTGHPIGDPMPAYITSAGKSRAVFGALELADAKREATVDDVVDYESLTKGIKKRGAEVSMAEILIELMAKDKPDIVQISFDFPTKLAFELQAKGIKLEPQSWSVLTERAVKTRDEVQKIRQAQKTNETGFLRAEAILKESDISKSGVIMWQGQKLTSEILQTEINATQLREGAVSFGPDGAPIVRSGDQSAIVHGPGSGPLYANRFIIIDSFPKHRNQYYGDITRTYVKGAADQWHQDVYGAVLKAQQTALDMIKAGVDGKDIQAAVEKSFEEDGFKTGRTKPQDGGDYYGFFHGTGHSLGLYVHDGGPRMLTRTSCELLEGYVTTVEPGLYYPPGTHKGGVGGCRIEDAVVVTKDGCENLVTLPKDKWVID